MDFGGEWRARMPKVRVAGFGVSLDGFSAGTEQSLSDPLGKRGTEIFQWFFHTKTFCAMHGQEGGSIDVDDEFARRSMENFGAFILGRNMFGPVRGPWPDSSWKGWWGDSPPYHAPTFVLTHYEREPLVMQGGTTFHFVTGGIEEALRRAKQAAGDKDVKIGGGVSTVRQYLQAGLIDSLHFALAPVVLGRGEALFTGLDLPALGFSVTKHEATERATHFVLEKG
jgi:dihydrofolate reductase